MNCNSTDLKSIGKRIKLARKNCKMKQEELANKLNCSREIISYYENGNRDIKTGTLIALSEILGVTTDYLLGISQAKTRDIEVASVCEYTGLSEKAVNLLNRTKNRTSLITSNILSNLNFYVMLTRIEKYRQLIENARGDEEWQIDGDYNPIIDVPSTKEGEMADFELFQIQKLLYKIIKDGANNG